MASHPLTDYLLKLAEDDNEKHEYQKSKANAHARMSSAGVPKSDQDILLSGMPGAISDAVQSEFASASASEYYQSVCLTVPKPPTT